MKSNSGSAQLVVLLALSTVATCAAFWSWSLATGEIKEWRKAAGVTTPAELRVKLQKLEEKKPGDIVLRSSFYH